MPSHPLARKAALDKIDEQIAKTREQLKAAFHHYPPPPRTNNILHDATLAFAVSGYAALSNLSVRRSAGEALIDVMLEQRDKQKHDASVRTFLMTASFDAGFCFEDAPVVDLASIRLSVRRALKNLGLQAVCVFEVDVLAKKLPEERSRRLIFHVHAVCWTRDPHFKPVAAGCDLSKSRYFPNMLTAPSFTFVSRAMAAARRNNSSTDPRFANLKRDQIARSMAWMGHYMLKPPLYAKNRHEQRDGGIVMRADGGAFRLKTAMRMAEIWSKISVNQAVFAVGSDADKLVRKIKKRIAGLTRDTGSAKQRELGEFTIARAWANFFQAHSKLGFEPSVILHRRS